MTATTDTTGVDGAIAQTKTKGRRARRGRVKRALVKLIEAKNRYDRHEARIVSFATQADRKRFLLRAMDDLHDAGFKLAKPENLKPRHVAALVGLWEERGHSATAMHKYHGYLRTLAGWIGKEGMVLDLEHYLKDPNRAKRIRVATEDHSWTTKGVDPKAKIEEVFAHDPHVGVCLMLQEAFWLRAKEAWLLRPREVDVTDIPTVLRVEYGTKGGRPRDVPITETWQRDVILLARELANHATGSMIPAHIKLVNWSVRFYYVCRKFGIARKNGLVPHGLRHQGANDAYERMTGNPTPVRGGRAPMDHERMRDILARRQISHTLGHGRGKVTTAYMGAMRRLRNADSTDTARPERPAVRKADSDPTKE
jgi:integrase